MRDEALLLSSGLSLKNGNVAKVLHFFGVPWHAATVTDFLGCSRRNHENSSKSPVLCSSDTFFELIQQLEENSEAIQPWRERVHSVFVHAGDVPAVLQKLMQRLTGFEAVVINQMNRFGGDFVVTDELDDFCGVMAGVRVSASKANVDASLVLNTARGNAINIISLGHGAIFLKVEYKGVPVFLSTSREIIDIDAELASQNFDVCEHFLSAVPLVLYIKWAFAETCWSAPETNACLVIDDPLLKPTHGFVDFQELLSLMKRHKFSKRTDLIAAVNNDVISAGPHQRAVMISELWDIAVMGYSNFPIFTRRYPWEGIENFAFDALLGKPAIAVIHHDYCSDHCVRLVDFIDRLNALQCAPTWRSLGEVVRRSCRQREVSPGEMEVEMYGTELRIENRSDQPKHFIIRKRECEPSAIQRICTGSQMIAWKPVDGHVDFEIELNPGENQVIKIRFHELAEKACNGDNLPYRLKAMLRRYLCEVRDNYVTPIRFRFAGLVSR